jgi:molecular chaperone GrpE (heat shock protein)
MSDNAAHTNLDLHAAQTAQAIILAAEKVGKAQDAENLITKALGVLQENGVYACALFLYARTSDRKIAEAVSKQLLMMTDKLDVELPEQPDKKFEDWRIGLKFVSDQLCSDLDRLLLVRQIWEQTLIYARYGAKAWGKQ